MMLNEKPVNTPGIAAKQIEELWKLWQETPVGCCLPFGKTESPLCSFEAKNFVPLLGTDSLPQKADELCKFTCGEHVASCQYLRRAVYSPLPRFPECGSQNFGCTQLQVIELQFFNGLLDEEVLVLA